MKSLAIALALATTSVAAEGFPEGGKFLNLSNQYVQTDTGDFVRYVPKVLVYQLPDGGIVHLKRGEAFPEWRLKQIELQSWVTANNTRREQAEAKRIAEHNATVDSKLDKLNTRRDNLTVRIGNRKKRSKTIIENSGYQGDAMLQAKRLNRAAKNVVRGQTQAAVNKINKVTTEIDYQSWSQKRQENLANNWSRSVELHTIRDNVDTRIASVSTQYIR